MKSSLDWVTDQSIKRQLLLAVTLGIALAGVIGCLIISGIATQPSLFIAFATPTVSRTATGAATITRMPNRTATFTRTPLQPTPMGTQTPSLDTIVRATIPVSATAEPTAILSPSSSRLVAQHFLVGRPVMPDVRMPYPDPVYLYGTTEKGEYEIHHGEDLENPIGTSLYAVADGRVVTAGSDSAPICGDVGRSLCGPYLSPPGYYGNLVVIQLSQSYQGQRVFALYGHLSQMAVSVGDPVKVGDPIGEIGMSGVAIGPHVHFEVRLGLNDYAHTRNPILWMTPLAGHGSLAGRYTDPQGNLVPGALVDVYRADDTFVHETETYSRDRWPAVNSDDTLGENFAMGDLPTGDYVVRIYGQPFEQRVMIEEGKLSMVEIGGS